MPHRPKPPDMMVMPSRRTPASAAAGSGYCLLTATFRNLPRVRPSCHSLAAAAIRPAHALSSVLNTVQPARRLCADRRRADVRSR